MLLSDEARAELESFFGGWPGGGGARVGRVRVHAGRCAGWVTRAARAGAVTFGRHVFVAPSLVTRGGGAARASGRLLAHEVAHVLQYEREGALRFLARYASEYAAGLLRERRCDAETRTAAYRRISFEREARAAERAFAAWRAGNDRDK